MTRNEIIEMAEEAGFNVNGELILDDMGYVTITNRLEAFAKLVAAKEREACAEMCDSRLEKWISLFGKDKMYKWMLGLPKAIRARGEA